MNKNNKNNKNIIIASLIISLALMVSAILFQYFSDYKSCLRDNDYKGERRAHIICSKLK